MPIIQVKYSSSRKTPDLEIAAKDVALATEVLGKDPAVTAVVVDEVSTDRWFCGGR